MTRALFSSLLCTAVLMTVPARAGQNFHAGPLPGYQTGASSAAPSYSGGGVMAALRAANNDEWGEARSIAAGLSGTDKDIVRWKLYRDGAPGNDFSDMAAFVRTHTDWPLMDIVRLEAEKIIPEGLSADQAIAWFSENPPQTAKGMRVYAAALRRTGREAELEKVLTTFWETAEMSRDQQKQFYADYGRYLDRASHQKRLDALISRGDYNAAYGVADVLGPDYVALAQARIAMANGEGDINGYLNRVPASLQKDEGLLYERLRWRRRHDLDDGAVEILNMEPSYGAKYDSAAWWTERQMIARRFLERKNDRKAYDLAKNHRQKEGAPFAEAEWLAGWIALEHLGKTWDAFEHFERMYHKVETPISRARGAYWAGRASAKLNHPEVAQKWYQTAAKEIGTFYGQMAAAELGQAPALPKSFNAHGSSALASMRSMVEAAKAFDRAGLRPDASAFLFRIGKLAETPEQSAAAAELADDMGYRHVAIKTSQEAQSKYGIYLVDSAYPSITKYLSGVSDVEWALVHALIRQESRFDAQAVSSVGARGLMQVMPATAKQVAGKMGISHQTDWLISRPDHNIKLGTRYIAQMLDQFDNNYAMAIAAYNAGPGRSVKWANTYGDPRRGEISLVDWIESIPFSETRNYVQRVLEGVYMYRLLLDGKQKRCAIPIHVPTDG